jgi:uncharacterized protein (DUF302 family)
MAIMDNQGKITRRSSLTVKEIIDELEKMLVQKGITVYVRIDQQVEAAKAGITLNGLEFLLFGDPAKGGRVMADNPEAALDLPLKVLAWEDAQQQTWVTYNDTAYIRQRFGLSAETAGLINVDPLITALLQREK